MAARAVTRERKKGGGARAVTRKGGFRGRTPLEEGGLQYRLTELSQEGGLMGKSIIRGGRATVAWNKLQMECYEQEVYFHK